jgi:hypothetical protein
MRGLPAHRLSRGWKAAPTSRLNLFDLSAKFLHRQQEDLQITYLAFVPVSE